MESKHTKGEWFACCKTARPHFVFSDDGETAICSIISKQDLGFELPIDEVQANAKLIAAAPDLLEALVSLRKWAISKGISIDGKLIINADNAINKAHGK